MMLGGFSRFGLWRQIGVAVVLLIAMQMANTAATAAAIQRDGAWPLVYGAPLTGIAIAVGLMAYAQIPRRRSRQASAPGQAAAT
jgi:lipopolysaccharide export system permease protein